MDVMPPFRSRSALISFALHAGTSGRNIPLAHLVGGAVSS
jgi:hypothetical protein